VKILTSSKLYNISYKTKNCSLLISANKKLLEYIKLFIEAKSHQVFGFFEFVFYP